MEGSQRVILVRHGEGHHNATRDFKLDDPRLTERGVEQARALRLHPLLADAELVAVSPLSRAVQTALEAFDGGSCPAGTRFVLSPLHAECSFSRCDKGRPKSALAADFPQIASWEGFAELREDWMHPRSDRSNWRTKRLPAFREWLAAQPERRVVAVGHGEFFRGLCGRALDNCEVLELTEDLARTRARASARRTLLRSGSRTKSRTCLCRRLARFLL